MSTGGLRALAQFLGATEDCHLRALRLDKCGVSDKAAALLFRGVERAASLKSLSIARNRVGPRATMALARTVRGSHTDLRDVCVSGNAIHGAPLAALCEALGHCMTVHRLDLSWNLLGKTSDDEREAYSGKPRSTALYLTYLPRVTTGR